MPLLILSPSGPSQSPSPASPPTAPPQATLKSLLSFIRYFFPSQTRIYNTSLPSDAAVTIRTLCEGLPKDVSWREGRAWVVDDGNLRWEEDEAAEDGLGTLVVRGYVRGGCLSADRLVHIPGAGDFQISQVRMPLHRRSRAV